MTNSLPDYQHLDLSGEAQQAASRMEARSREAASEEMFEQLVLPLLGEQVRTVLEFGSGTAALSRRIARAAPLATVYASDKSEGMLRAARFLVEAENLPNLQLGLWDVLDESKFPFRTGGFDLIISSVVIPYLSDDQVSTLVTRLSSRLSPGGILAFLEQDLSTDTVYFPDGFFFREVLTSPSRRDLRPSPLFLRPLLRQAGLQVLPRRSFLWTDETYGDYLQDLLGRFADAACQRDQIQPDQRDDWKKKLGELASQGDFYYGIVYHLIAARRS